MRHSYAAMLCASLTLFPSTAFAQSAKPAASPLDTDTSYQTMLALIDEMVANKLVSRERADALIATARRKAQTAIATAAPPPAVAAVPPQNLAATPPYPGAKVAPVAVSQLKTTDSPAPPLPADLAVDWTRGAPVLSSRDGMFSFKPRGRILADISSSTGSAYDPRNITVSTLRQFRFGGVGTIGKNLFYQFEADFRRNAVEVVQTFVGYRTKFGKTDADIRFGNLITDRGMDIGTAATANPFITTNINTTALATQGGRVYLLGVAARAGGENWHVSAAVHGDAIDSDFTRGDNRMFLTRAHWNPILTKNAVVHVGGWVYDENIPGTSPATTVVQNMSGAINNSIRVESAPLTGATGSTAFGLEFGGTLGKIYAFSEYGQRTVRGGPGATFAHAKVKALSVNGGWWITGEKPTYSSRSGTYLSPHVKHSILDGGIGAFELVARYEDMDASGLPLGGTGWAGTVGLNWYLTNNFRFMADYIHYRTDNRTGSFQGRDTGDTLAARAEVAF
ncbi:porin [Sphingomonas sp. CARO-RG-8B-R24-01]|uniref:OprO/OprP family phosphate-selective porin n=1 Tax=Sphingomonas sp. CARO-RG-8B-R24-01 TaxID=2914831 RepID=UPI001F588582|nr:porin [Sphingomonas sp. CARO-RG-8B-R24-01]